jgi:hypothetical protein
MRKTRANPYTLELDLASPSISGGRTPESWAEDIREDDEDGLPDLSFLELDSLSDLSFLELDFLSDLSFLELDFLLDLSFLELDFLLDLPDSVDPTKELVS